jgi:ribosomal protein S18 acetylase RimI-like enzyme
MEYSQYIGFDIAKLQCKQITSGHKDLEQVIKSSIGNPTNAKIKEVLKSYDQQNRCLIGSFYLDELIAIIGFEVEDKIPNTDVIIKHISVLDKYRSRGVGRLLIDYLIKNFSFKLIAAETDNDAIDFYRKLAFKCKPIQNHGNLRYYCCLALS